MEPLNCPAGYRCDWSVYMRPTIADVPADWTGLLTAVVLIVLIVTIGVLACLWLDYKSGRAR